MAYVGTPIDTRNQFQSLAGKRFNGDGSTTAFTLDVAPSSTLDIEVFVGNVRQDPNSAYTLSGTTLTFTGAPPSGTNNIYVVHQAKAVGTIDLPEGALVDLNGGSDKLVLDADGDTTISADTDDQIDFKVANADQIKLTDGVLAPSTDNDIDLGTSSLEFKDAYFDGTITSDGGTFDTLGVINAHDLGAGIHIKTADSGASVSSEADELVIEHGNAIGGMSFLAATDGLTKIAFGDSGNNDAGIIHYSHDNTTMAFTVEGTERMSILGDGAVKVVTSFFIETERDDTQKINVEFGGNNEGGILLNDKDAANNGTFVQFRRSNTQIGTIKRNGTSDAVSYNTSSDYRLKDGIVDLTGGIDTIKKLKPRKFYWKSDTDKNLIDGFIAHEVQDVAELSHAVTGAKDATRQITDGDGVTTTEMDTQGLDYSKLVTYLTAALQESITKIETLEAKVKALEEA
jgi:hypothetical protein